MKELNMSELEDLHGGIGPFWIAIGSGLIGSTIGAVVNGWPEFKRGFQEAYWHQQQIARQ